MLTERARTLVEPAESLDVPMATTHRLCAGLPAPGLGLVKGQVVRSVASQSVSAQAPPIACDADERRFTIGPALPRMAFDTLDHDPSKGLRHEVLALLVEEVGETRNFTTLDGAGVLYLDRTVMLSASVA